ncbi:hypothetical protein [Pseudomonas aeruginosa]|uniref:hypothetical protein n=1 Tax=Pseudomonas aeruginosa TaxID=287 RepID=UPI001298778C|nr:hypothetical protein [Pseudomonas aeruginosa]WIK39827.1 hypothetical protein OI910_30805 [Pseudomonas aeruginosa]
MALLGWRDTYAKASKILVNLLQGLAIMLVKVSAFDIDINSAIFDYQAVADLAAGVTGIVFEENRTFYFDTAAFPGFCVGVIITVKDQKSFCTLDVGGAAGAVIKVNNLDEHNQIMDFNFFALNIENGIGVYQHYHQSAPLSVLERLLKVQVRTEKERRIAAAVAAEEARLGKQLSASQASKIQRAHKSYLKVGVVVRPETLKAQLEEYAKIKGMEYTYTVLTPEVLEATPLSNRIKKKKETLVFTNPNIVDSLAREISAAVRQFGINRGNVIVEDDEGVTRHIKIMDMPEVLWEQEYETVVALIDDINPNDFANNDYLKSLVDLFDHADYTHLLRANV